MNKPLFNGIVALCCCLLLASCVKDTDLDQAEQITLTPVVEFVAFHLDLPAARFYDPIKSQPILAVTDTTEIRFLDDEFFREHLKGAELYFKYTNTMNSKFNVDYLFLSRSNKVTYSFTSEVLAGDAEFPVTTELFQNLEGVDLDKFTQANRFVIKINIENPGSSRKGSLNLKSKGTYFLEH